MKKVNILFLKVFFVYSSLNIRKYVTHENLTNRFINISKLDCTG